VCRGGDFSDKKTVCFGLTSIAAAPGLSDFEQSESPLRTVRSPEEEAEQYVRGAKPLRTDIIEAKRVET
jgi:hypothetical protein